MLEFGQKVAASGPGTAGVSPAKSRLKVKIGGCGIPRRTAQAAGIRMHEYFAGETPAVPGAGFRAV
jgi:hypothetical protein